MHGTEWLIIDTETDGLMDPIHVVEIAAQRMSGWEPVGDKFRVLLNHNVPIPPAAVAVHGYTEEFLRRNGLKPLEAHALFQEYAQGIPMVAHNLAFDWNRALSPEWGRLGLAPAGSRGFCSLMLSRRVVDGTASYSLDALRDVCKITRNNAHRAFGDVDALVALFGGVFRPKLEGAGINTFDRVLEFVSKTPVAKCLALLKSPAQVESIPNLNWYFIDASNQSRGPLPAIEILSLMEGAPCWVWREGLADWVSSDKNAEFQQSVRTPNILLSKRASAPRRKRVSKIVELKELCRVITADGVVTTQEVVQLANWVEQAGALTEWPATEIAQTLERVLADGIVTDTERLELLHLLDRATDDEPTEARGSQIQDSSMPANTTKMELSCVGNAGGGYINAQIRVVWFEVLANTDRKQVDVVEHHLEIKELRRENRVNYCTYHVPDGVTCYYERYVQTKPKLHERKFFRFQDGVFQDLGEGGQEEFVQRFLQDYGTYSVCVAQSAEDIRHSRTTSSQSGSGASGLSISLGAVTSPTVTELPSIIQPPVAKQLVSLVQLVQGTPEWLEWRNGGIGASDAPVIMGENPWKTVSELIREKRSPIGSRVENAAMAMGTALEPEARRAYITKTGKLVEPACLQNGAHEWLRASVDGITTTLNAAVEIKCGKSVYQKTAATGRPPQYYYGQLQHILAVTGLPAIDFWCYLPGLRPLLVSIQRDESYIARMLEAELQFWMALSRSS
jgi:putative phage-type endonuclease